MSFENNVIAYAKGPMAGREYGFLGQAGQKDIFITKTMLMAAGFSPTMFKFGVEMKVNVSIAVDGRRRVEKIHRLGSVQSAYSTGVAPAQPKTKFSQRSNHRRDQKKTVSSYPQLTFFLKVGDRAVGKIKPNFKHENGFGFILVTSVKDHKDVFVHINNIPDSIEDEALADHPVEFAIGEIERNGGIYYQAIVIGLHLPADATHTKLDQHQQVG